MDLVGDIGGTTIRLALVRNGGLGPVTTCSASEAGGVEDVIRTYLARNGNPEIRHAALGVAAPVTGDEVSSPNGPKWSFSCNALQRALGFDRLTVENDFAAAALGIQSLQSSDLDLIGKVQPGYGPRRLLGPGTGFGLATIFPTPAGWQVVAGEAGLLPPPGKMYKPLIDYIGERFDKSRIGSYLSGEGLSRIHEAVCVVEQKRKRQFSLQPLEAIVGAAAKGNAEAKRAVEVFVGLLGRVAGNLALDVMATGGVYLTGGVVAGLAKAGLLDTRLFRRRFDMDRVPGMEDCTAILKTIPVACVKRDDLALIGLREFLTRSRVPALSALRRAEAHGPV